MCWALYALLLCTPVLIYLSASKFLYRHVTEDFLSMNLNFYRQWLLYIYIYVFLVCESILQVFTSVTSTGTIPRQQLHVCPGHRPGSLSGWFLTPSLERAQLSRFLKGTGGAAALPPAPPGSAPGAAHHRVFLDAPRTHRGGLSLSVDKLWARGWLVKCFLMLY